MTDVTRLNLTEQMANFGLMEFIELIPGTIISLTTGMEPTVGGSIDRVTTFKKQAGARPERAGEGR